MQLPKVTPLDLQNIGILFSTFKRLSPHWRTLALSSCCSLLCCSSHSFLHHLGFHPLICCFSPVSCLKKGISQAAPAAVFISVELSKLLCHQARISVFRLIFIPFPWLFKYTVILRQRFFASSCANVSSHHLAPASSFAWSFPASTVQI